ncbi:hypothetical protein F0562_017794 [Nyssa sinensis]|uniref:Auxin efflux carrier component n=1 Tax=Nyssa sinensis TaxID=561372 RepID=A0A5J4ZJ43_9ASTE|nr:hypothetical protein F0562_017794 [Nyssa sinensis]
MMFLIGNGTKEGEDGRRFDSPRKSTDLFEPKKRRKIFFPVVSTKSLRPNIDFHVFSIGNLFMNSFVCDKAASAIHKRSDFNFIGFQLLTEIMERFLSAVLMENHGGESLLGSIKIAVLPIAKVFTMCFLGFLMASKYVDILPASGRKLLNGLVFSLLLPCLIFSQLGQAITLQKMIEWWFIPFNVVLATITGSIIGLVVASIVRPPYPFFKFTIIQIGIGNIGNVPLVLIAALCRDKSNPFGDSDKCAQNGNAYISFGQWVGAIVLYTYVFHMLAPPPEGRFDIEDSDLPIKSPSND